MTDKKEKKYQELCKEFMSKIKVLSNTQKQINRLSSSIREMELNINYLNGRLETYEEILDIDRSKRTSYAEDSVSNVKEV